MWYFVFSSCSFLTRRRCTSGNLRYCGSTLWDHTDSRWDHAGSRWDQGSTFYDQPRARFLNKGRKRPQKVGQYQAPQKKLRTSCFGASFFTPRRFHRRQGFGGQVGRDRQKQPSHSLNQPLYTNKNPWKESLHGL